MKKIRIVKIMMILLAAMLVFGGYSGSRAEAASKKKIAEAERAFQKKRNKLKNRVIRYGLYDLNGDKIPEMFCQVKNNVTADRIVYRYDTKKKKIKKLMVVGERGFYHVYKNQLIVYGSGGYKYEVRKVYVLSKGKLKKVKEYVQKPDDDDRNIIRYYKNGKEIKEETYQKFEDWLFTETISPFTEE